MPRPLNPFDPSRPIDPARFIGRAGEIKELEAALLHAKHGRPRHFLITGERGVGKTSFLDFIRSKAVRGDFNFIVIDFSINKQTTKLDFARALKAQIESLLDSSPTHRETLAKAWGFITRFEIAGVSYKDEKVLENHRDLYQEVADALCEVVARMCGEPLSNSPLVACGGVLILVDEIDQSSDELDLGSFLKYLLERLNRKGCHKVIVGLAGLTESTQVLVRSHASSLRIFDELPLVNLERDEVGALLDDVQIIDGDDWFGEFKITQEARDILFKFSGGHPHMLHQLGYCAFEEACKVEGGELVVELSHVISGAFGRRGAFDLIGDVYFRKPIEEIEKIPGVLRVLDHLCEISSGDTLARISDELGFSEIEVNSLLNALLGVGLIARHDGNHFGVRHAALPYWLKAWRPQRVDQHSQDLWSEELI